MRRQLVFEELYYCHRVRIILLDFQCNLPINVISMSSVMAVGKYIQVLREFARRLIAHK